MTLAQHAVHTNMPGSVWILRSRHDSVYVLSNYVVHRIFALNVVACVFALRFTYSGE